MPLPRAESCMSPRCGKVPAASEAAAHTATEMDTAQNPRKSFQGQTLPLDKQD